VRALRVVVAEDNLLVRAGVRALLEMQDDVELVGLCASLDELLLAVADARPDVVVTDVRMPPSGSNEGIRAANLLRRDHPDIGVVVLSQWADPSYALALVADGSRGRGYLLKERVGTVGELMRAVRTVAAGGSYIDSDVVDLMVAARSRQRSSPMTWLTARERQVLAELATGKSNAAIASELGVTARAIEKHINSLFAKLGLSEDVSTHRRVKAALMFLYDGQG
jgi:DNA-binding NarL/FixJ family response regulator